VYGVGLAAASGRPFVPSFVKIGHLLRSLKRHADGAVKVCVCQRK